MTMTGSTFSGIGLKSWLVSQCHGLGMKEPTPVQVNCIPSILEGKDCIGCAKTGSGKTAAFALPILNKLSDDPYGIFAIILTPTRELAFQIKDQFVALGAHICARVSVIVGGMDMLPQSLELARKPHIVVATPGRLADHISSGDGLNLSKVKYLVMDEADRLFEPCFEADLGTILGVVPRSRQTLLFSATLTETIEQLKGASPSPPHVYIAPAQIATVETLEQNYVLVPELMRNTALAQTLSSHVKEETCIIFTHSCKSAQILTLGLKKLGFPCTALHSVLNQSGRLASLAKFKGGIVKILVATDVASRGLDIPTVSFVLNYNTPSSPTDYIHRVGRTARAGSGGHAITIITQHDIERLQAIESVIGTKLTELQLPDEASVKLMQPVSLAMREALLHLDTHQFGEKKQRNKSKQQPSTTKRVKDTPNNHRESSAPTLKQNKSKITHDTPDKLSTKVSGGVKKKKKKSKITVNSDQINVENVVKGNVVKKKKKKSCPIK